MALIRKSLKQLEAKPPVINAKLMKATSAAKIRRQMIEDGDDPKAALPDYRLNLVREARAKLAMTQTEMAALTKIPLATLRNWEQGRTTPDAAAKALFKLIVHKPKENAKILQG
jgi:putative transcriptional regulator